MTLAAVTARLLEASNDDDTSPARAYHAGVRWLPSKSAPSRTACTRPPEVPRPRLCLLTLARGVVSSRAPILSRRTSSPPTFPPSPRYHFRKFFVEVYNIDSHVHLPATYAVSATTERYIRHDDAATNRTPAGLSPPSLNKVTPAEPTIVPFAMGCSP